MKIRKTLLAGAAIAALALAGCASGGGGGSTDNSGGGGDAAPEHLKVAVYGSTEELVIDIAEEQGLFADAGIEVEKVIIGAPPALVAATQSNEVDIAMIPTILAVRTMAEGVPLTIVGALDGSPVGEGEKYDSGALFASQKSGITSMSQLAGKTIVVSARGSSFEVSITNALIKAGVDPASINWVTMDFATSLPALKDGSVDAAPMISPFDLQAKAQGSVVLGYPGSDFLEGAPVDLWLTSNETAEKRGDALRAFRDATYQAAAWANANEDAVKKLGIEIGGVDMDPADMKPMHFFESDVPVSDLERINQTLIDMGFLDSKATFTFLN
ncbi:MAG: ABC transporter substrate-binding protein [Leucobacter sp.]|nr:ABC transporter substrate-binding protein [Leucobacter sp.]